MGVVPEFPKDSSEVEISELVKEAERYMGM
jgi:hypothetical protein